MLKSNILISIFAFLIFFNLVHAGTVVLTGSCNATLVNSSIVFSLSNSGNDSAYNLIISPIVEGATPLNTSYSINVLAPGQTNTIYVKLTNFGLNGTYADTFVVAYQQGFSFFTAVFPCLVSINKPTVSPIRENVETTSLKNMVIVNVSLFNAERAKINGSLYLIVPPTLSFISNKSYSFSLSNYSEENFTFKLEPPKSGASYSSAAVASFNMSNLHYSSMVIFSITPYAAKSAFLSPLEITATIVAIILLIALFLLARSVKNKKRREREHIHEEQHMQEHKPNNL
ncbi:MAG: hypothetical protein RXR32_02130 [Candidatus Micrarchaeota archaeon]